MNEIERAKLKMAIKYFKNECKWYAKAGWGSDEDAIACEVALTLCRAELSRQENAPLTMEDVVSEAYDRGYNLGYSDGYQDGTKGEETE